MLGGTDLDQSDARLRAVHHLKASSAIHPVVSGSKLSHRLTCRCVGRLHGERDAEEHDAGEVRLSSLVAFG